MAVVAFRKPSKRSKKAEEQIQTYVEYAGWRNLISKELRLHIANKKTMKSIAEETGLHHTTISKLVSGETTLPRMDTIMRIFKYLGYKLVAMKTNE